jgi:hypothetical protein
LTALVRVMAALTSASEVVSPLAIRAAISVPSIQPAGTEEVGATGAAAGVAAVPTAASGAVWVPVWPQAASAPIAAPPSKTPRLVIRAMCFAPILFFAL